MAIKEIMLRIDISIIAEGAIYLVVVTIFTDIFPEAAMPSQKLCHVKSNMNVSSFNPTLYISDKSTISLLIYHSSKLFCLSFLD